MDEQSRALREGRRLHDKAVAEGRYGHAGRAVRTLNHALDVLAELRQPGPDADKLVAEVWLSLAVNEAEVHGVERGLAMIAAAEPRVERTADPALQVRLHSNYGFLATRAGNLALADEQLRLALPMIKHATPHDRIYVLLNSGNICLYRGQLAEARRLLSAAAAAADADDILDGRFRALHNLGYVQFLAGDLPAALASMDDAAALGADISLGIWALDRSRILVEAGLTREADGMLAQAERVFRADRLAQDQGEVEVARAECALLAGDVGAARRFAARARDRFRRRGNAQWTRAAELVLLRGDLAAGRPGSRLIGPARRLHTELAAAGLRLPAHTAALIGAEAELAAGRADRAAAALAELGPPRRDDPPIVRLHDHYVHARSDVAAGRPAAAHRRIGRALRELAGYQARFGSVDLRTAAAVHGRRLAELGVAIALDSGKPADVFAAAERARAVSSRLPPVRPPEDPAAAELLAELRRTVEALRPVELDRAASAPLLRRRRELEAQLAARSWTVSGSGEASRPASLDAVRAALAEHDRTMVTYVQAAGRLAAVVVGRRTRLVDLGPARPVIEQVRRVRADLDVLASARLPGGLRSAARASLDRSLAGLDATLLGPTRVDGPLVALSTGVLGQLPWSSLPSRRGASVVVAPSATKWLSALTGGGGRGGVVAFAGPDLHRARDEVADVARAWPGAVTRVGAPASTAEFVAAVGTARLLHVAAHGLHQPENPLFSALRLADGPVFAHELRHPAPEHVVLSACEVGLATIRPGDEALGLASALLGLGTRSVIAGVARVGDEAAAETMAGYHTRLAAGADSADALAAALLDATGDVVPPFVNFGAAWLNRLPGTSLLSAVPASAG